MPPIAPRRGFIAGDPLRAVAALSVLAYHAAYAALHETQHGVAPELSWGAYGGVLGRVLENLDAGLFVFFVLSGYLIACPFVQSYLLGRPYPSLGTYSRNRLLRILPAFWFVATVVFVVHGTGGASPLQVTRIYGLVENLDASPPPVWAYLIHTWTLHAELGFYLLVPLIGIGLARLTPARVGPSARAALVCGLALLVAAGSLALRGVLPPTAHDTQLLQTNLFAFMPGVLLAAIEPAAQGRLAKDRRVGRRVLALLGVALCVLAALLLTERHPGRPEGVIAGLFSAVLVAMPLVLQWTESRCWGVLDNAPMRWVGERSYSIYLWHSPLILAIAPYGVGGIRPQFASILLMGVAGTLAAASLSYRFVELPFLRQRMRSQQPALAADSAPGRA
jgi:peptidoglycan/LPS O-acetylase OafA/YrhL